MPGRLMAQLFGRAATAAPAVPSQHGANPGQQELGLGADDAPGMSGISVGWRDGRAGE